SWMAHMVFLAYARRLNSLRPRLAVERAAVLGLFVILGCLVAGSPDEMIDEYKVKAAFIFNFAKFVQWPAASFQNAKQPTAICVLGQDPFGGWLTSTLAGRDIEGRPFTVRNLTGARQVAGCHVLFMGSSEDRRLPAVLAEIRTPGTLTIGESSAALDSGVMIVFRLEGGKIRFDINLDAAERADLRISSRLLSLARSVAGNRK
ncbi:MAG: YfiR family protein, partial [Acidobacteriota bacterium]